MIGAQQQCAEQQLSLCQVRSLVPHNPSLVVSAVIDVVEWLKELYYVVLSISYFYEAVDDDTESIFYRGLNCLQPEIPCLSLIYQGNGAVFLGFRAKH